jgi:hypothetical protein
VHKALAGTAKMRAMHSFVHVASLVSARSITSWVSLSACLRRLLTRQRRIVARAMRPAWPELIVQRKVAIGVPPAETPSVRATRVPSYFPNGRGRNVRLAA